MLVFYFAAYYNRKRNESVSLVSFGSLSVRCLRWQAKCVENGRYTGVGCPYCAGIMVVAGVNDLQSQFANISKQWDYRKNLKRPDEVHAHSNKYAWWRCQRGHSWRALINNRTRKGLGCPYCSGLLAIPGETDLLTLCPDLASEWDYDKNNLDIRSITGYSSKLVWWVCKRGHSWCVAVKTRRKGNGCPYCAGKKAIPGETDLLTLAPHLGKEWDHEKNTVKMNELTLKSNVRACGFI